ncbi:MAG: hypothetical protein H6Q00_420 [Holophagaceae bacterium]|nr:hypothetical protein [Holophagaceae bacterium]
MNTKATLLDDVSPSRIFQGFVERCQSLPEYRKGDRHPLYERYCPEPDGPIDAQKVGKCIYKEIKTTLGRKTGWTLKDLGRIKQQMIYEHEVYGSEVLPALKILSVIHDALLQEKTFLPITSESAEWQSVAQAAHNYLELNPHFMDNIIELHNRTRNVGKAAKALQDRGFQVELANGEVRLSEKSFTAAFERLQRLIRMVGPRSIVSCIFRSLTPRFDPIQGRYLYVRNAPTMPVERPPAAPVGYILNLCVREWEAPVTRIDMGARTKAMKELEDLARDLVAILDVEPYNAFESMFVGGTEMLPFLQKAVIYDSAFSFPQMRPSDVLGFLKGVFDWVDDAAFKKSSGWSMTDALIVIGNIINLAKGKHGPVDILESEFDPGGRIPIPELRALLKAMSHSKQGVNRGYRSAMDVSKADFSLKPLMKRADNRYLLLDLSWCSPAFYEVFASAARAFDKNADSKIGTEAESFLAAEFNRHGISIAKGNYKVPGKEGECDVVVEMPRFTLFIEMKKKVLTRSARSGNDLDILVDLSHSLVAAQTQAGWHEVHIRQQKSLQLDDKGRVSTISLDGREVERVAVSLLDYGAFQDRNLLTRFLTTVMNVEFTAHDTRQDSKLNTFREYQANLRAQHTQLVVLNPGMERFPFFNCWFLSVPQLLVLLDGVTDNKAFQEAILAVRHIHFGTSDFYAELSAGRKLSEAAVP